MLRMQLFLKCIAVHISVLLEGREAAQTVTDVIKKRIKIGILINISLIGSCIADASRVFRFALLKVKLSGLMLFFF
jgi:hypothetical protein